MENFYHQVRGLIEGGADDDPQQVRRDRQVADVLHGGGGVEGGRGLLRERRCGQQDGRCRPGEECAYQASGSHLIPPYEPVDLE